MKPFQRLLVAAPAAALLPVVLAPASSLANEAPLNLESVQEYSIAQGATIRDFSDVYPTDWAYQALAKLVDTYGCVSGFPDGTFRGNQPMTRFEVAAVLNSCLDSISGKMDMMGEEMKMSAMEDMDTLERLVASFEEELITLKGRMDGLDAKVSELEDSQFSTTTKASFKIATDFTYFASEDLKDSAELTVKKFDDLDPKNLTPEEQDVLYVLDVLAKQLGADDAKDLVKNSLRGQEDNSGFALSSKAEIKFKTSFTGSDKLTFKLKGDLLSSSDPYSPFLGHSFYDMADNGDTGVEFGGFTYETTLDLGGMSANLIFGTDYADFDGVVGLDTYYGGGGYDHYGPSNFGDVGIGFNVDFISSDAGTLTASASYAVADDHAADQGGDRGLFGEETDRSGVLALSWEGALFGGNDALFTVAYQNVKNNNGFPVFTKDPMSGRVKLSSTDVTRNFFHLVAGAYFTDTLSLSGSWSWGNHDVESAGDFDSAQWMIALNMEDAIFPGNSAGVAYGTPMFLTDPKQDNVPNVLELYYTFSINDNFEIPIYLDFISNVDSPGDSSAFAFAVRPTLTF